MLNNFYVWSWCWFAIFVIWFPCFRPGSLRKIKAAQLCECNTAVGPSSSCEMLTMYFYVMFVTVSVLSMMLEQSQVCFDWIWSRVCSPSGQSDSGAVCVGDGVASEHRSEQELHLALLREWPAAGDIPDHCLGFRTTVSFHALMRLIHMPYWIRWMWHQGFPLNDTSPLVFQTVEFMLCFIMTTQSVLRSQQGN